jgi:hypothetical protein
MIISNAISRVAEYSRRHGFAATLRRAGLAARRAVFANRMVVFYCDLDNRLLRPINTPKTFKIERIRALTELRVEQFQQITSFWNPKLAVRNICERFDCGATLWIVECQNELAGYGWTLRGRAIEPYYFPLGERDVQLFDFFVLAKFRGRALHWLLTGHILHTLATEGVGRAYADTHEWNAAQLASFKMTPLRCLGLVRTYNFFGRQLRSWTQEELAVEPQRIVASEGRTLKVLRSNE